MTKHEHPTVVSRDEWLAARKALLGRREDWEEPPGRSDSPFLAWVRHRDKYDDAPDGSRTCCTGANEETANAA